MGRSMAITPQSIAVPSEPAPVQAGARPGRTSMRSALLRITTMVFIATLFVPLIGAWRQWDFFSASNENRQLAGAPKLPRNFKDAQRYSDRWLDFFRDHFGFRNTLIHAVAETQVHGFVADTNGNVIIGKNGWLFFRPDGDHNLIAYRGLNPFSEDELTAWQNFLERRNAWLASKGIPFLVVIPPDKQTIYPEFLPLGYEKLRAESRLDQLIARLLQTHSPVHLIDLRPSLMAAKPTALLYHKTDTHWNDSGAFVAYGVIIKAVQELLPRWHIIPQTMNNFVRTPVHPEVGDLARMMDMPDQYPDRGFQLLPRIPYDVPLGLEDRNATVVFDSHDPTKPHLVIYRDSFTIALAPMLGPHFSRVAYACYYSLDPNLIEQEKPDLLISEFLERNLYLPPPTDPAEIRHFATR
jgi:alginate O-acetyltransferase complex protein AlgJ